MYYNNFYIEKNQYIDNKDLENARILYTPIIGPTALSLYQYLIDEANLADNPRKSFVFSEIPQNLCCETADLIEAKEKLEAVGLIRYYESGLFKNGIFSINKPLNIDQYQKSVLAKQLIKKIGEAKYQKILFAFSYSTFDKSEYKNKSKKFTDYFDITQNLKINLDKIHDDVTTTMVLKSTDSMITNSRPNEFIKFLTKREVSPTQMQLIQSLVSIGFTYEQINLFLNFSFEVNGQIVCSYVEKIAKDFSLRKIYSTNSIKLELDNALRIKRSSKPNNENAISNLKNEDSANVFDKYGLEGWND